MLDSATQRTVWRMQGSGVNPGQPAEFIPLRKAFLFCPVADDGRRFAGFRSSVGANFLKLI
jgi:hypothetical protein